MKCEEYVSGYCRQAVMYKKYAEVRDCEKCCVYCNDPCSNICQKALTIREENVDGD